jgi:Uncharacterized alpha/beta hydrolase domain (DUF2235)
MPKNIVLLSDGTGNSAAQLLKTNVWRVYESLDLSDPTSQVACYDDGVGTSSFKPLALLGGAFGVGLKRNVLRLYRFACEHYEPGDRIYAFGFSRGAFTIRILIGLICEQGIIPTRPPVVGRSRGDAGDAADAATAGEPAAPGAAPPATANSVYGNELARLCRWAYREFRRGFKQTHGLLIRPGRKLRDLAIRTLERKRKAYDQGQNHPVDRIAFVGVWDTVDAYGLPMDELTDGVDRWVWPLSMPDCKLSPKVRKACHVLALDDERNTFHPVLWDEADEPQTEAHIDDERISQVWFAGMHSNVGGGYPDDALSGVSLGWMTRQARDHGLLFHPELLDHHVAKGDTIGRIYDSRSGLKGYYRYNPRRIEWLTNGQTHEMAFFKRRWPRPSPTVTIGRPKVHESVIDRIRAAPEAYAPIVLPQEYAVVTKDGSILDGDANPFESGLQRQARYRNQERAWNLVWRKRAVYFLAVGVSLVLAIMPFTGEAGRTLERGALTRAVLSLGELLPSFASPWVRYYAAYPVWLFGGLIVLYGLSRRGSRLQSRICDGMRKIWLQVTAASDAELKAIALPTDRLYRIRSSRVYQGAFAVLRRKVLPNVFGILILAGLAFALVRLPFEAASVAGLLCRGSDSAKPLGLNAASGPITFQSEELCAATGLRLDAGARYRIDLELPKSGVWRDSNIDAPFPAGFTSWGSGLEPLQRWMFALFTPLRRQTSGNWFIPVGRVGEKGIEHHQLTATTNEITALTSGELFLFVNDLIPPFWMCPWALGWDACYENNKGSATVTVRKIAKPPT